VHEQDSCGSEKGPVSNLQKFNYPMDPTTGGEFW